MSLRTKLIASFAGLAAIALLVIGVAVFTTFRWQAANAEMEMHFQRSLLLQSVRASTFQALKEVDDGLTGDHVDARADFEAALEPATRDFRAWAALADTQAERNEVARVRAAHVELVTSGRRVFDLVPVDRTAAIQLADDEVDTKDLARFRAITVAAVEADLAIREGIARETRGLRETAQVMLAIGAISVIALMLLIAAYLSSDLFRPLRQLSDVLARLADGDREARAEEGRNDEIGAVARGVNRVADMLGNGVREPAAASATALTPGLAHALRARLGQMRGQASEADWEAVDRMALALGAPISKRQAIDIATLFHDALADHRGEIDRRGIAVEQRLSSPLPRPSAPLDLTRRATDMMLGIALDRLPDRGGRLGLRAYVDPDSGATRIEAADDGGVAEIDLSPLDALAAALGGSARVFADARGQVVQLTLP
ncbi:putative Integral membrane sensor signal transduction histidine kinase [Sphingomonas sp. AX6]|nr:putative Integral membrane sensor signal transduction histidine kinase [Sphingomonas sp. AX6]